MRSKSVKADVMASRLKKGGLPKKDLRGQKVDKQMKSP
jgi:hypothetical protein